jgi:hypothetical protein
MSPAANCGGLRLLPASLSGSTVGFDIDSLGSVSVQVA